MRHKLILLTLLWFGIMPINATNVNLSDAYEQLDKVISNSPVYVHEHEDDIAEQRTALHETTNDTQRYAISLNLYEQYRSYVNDSAIVYLNRCISIARRMRRNDLAGGAMAELAFQCSTSGMYNESLDILKGIQTKQLDRAGIVNYYKAYTHVYQELASYTTLNDLRAKYQHLNSVYKDSLLAVADKNSEDYLFTKETMAYDNKQYALALTLNNKHLTIVKAGSHEFAIVAYYRYLIYKAMNDMSTAKYWLVQSAMCDTRNAVMDQASLWNLAAILNKDGDFERSYSYIQQAWSCIRKFNTRVRNWQILPILSIIDSNNQKQMRTMNVKLIAFTVVVSVIVVIVFGLLFVVYSQKRRLSSIHKQIGKTNDELEKLNKQLSLVNENLSRSNDKLNDSNRIKDEYIGRFLSICSHYVDKLDDYRRMVNRKVKNKEVDELYQMTKSSELKDKEMNELLASFDSIFLHLFPNFINDFNSMLKAEVQVYPKDTHSLTTDIRIFALIRLGIDDSGKIADFLHYSVNTIYNYRARIKNGALNDRESFEGRIKKIGMNS